MENKKIKTDHLYYLSMTLMIISLALSINESMFWPVIILFLAVFFLWGMIAGVILNDLIGV